jgi:hypothetical protein
MVCHARFWHFSAMKPVLVALLLFFSLDLDAADSPVSITLRGLVQSVSPLSGYSGKVIPIGADPRFALVLKIESVNPVSTIFVAGSNVTFAVHSPTRLFAGQPATNHSYDFRLKREVVDGKVVFSDLSVIHGKAK